MNIPKIWVKAEIEARGKRGPMQLAAWGWSAKADASLALA